MAGLKEAVVDEPGPFPLHSSRDVVVVAVVGISGHGPEVHTRREVPVGSGEDAGQDVSLGLHQVPGVGQPSEHRQGHGVLASRSIEGQDQYGAYPLNK